jgi:hypothetical protein
MRLLTPEEFLKEPPGTLYSLYFVKGTVFRDLAIKGDTLPDGCVQSQPLQNTVDVTTREEAELAILGAMNGGEYNIALDNFDIIPPPPDEYDIRFAVFSLTDMEKVLARMTTAYNQVSTHFQNKLKEASNARSKPHPDA